MSTKVVIFIFCSVVLAVISRKSLTHPKSHGFFRFFSWEFTFALFLLNVEWWIKDILAWNQIISWFLLFGSLIPLGFGIASLIQRGKPARQRADNPQLYGFENTTELVTTGIFRHIRHPLYSSLLWLTWGIVFKHGSFLAVILAIAASILLYLTALADEQECIVYFGDEYSAYMQKSKRFLPYVF